MFAEVGYPTEEIQDELNGIDGINTEDYDVHIAIFNSNPTITYCGINCEDNESVEMPYSETDINSICRKCIVEFIHDYR